MRTRSQAVVVPTLDALPDEILQLIIAAFTYVAGDPPVFIAVKRLAFISKALLQQLHRVRPLVYIVSPSHGLTIVQRPAHGPWRVTLRYAGELTDAVMEQARQGRVRSITAANRTLAPAMARRVVPELLGAGCSLIELNLAHGVASWSCRATQPTCTWGDTLGEAAVGSAVLRELSLRGCRLRGPLPVLRLPALQELDLVGCTDLSGGLEPLQGCTGLRKLCLSYNKFTGTLEPLRGCTALHTLRLDNNQLTGGLEPLRICTALLTLCLDDNQLTGGVEALRGCTVLQQLQLQKNQLAATDEDKARFEKQCQSGYAAFRI